jgi:hypothetical protein
MALSHTDHSGSDAVASSEPWLVLRSATLGLFRACGSVEGSQGPPTQVNPGYILES